MTKDIRQCDVTGIEANLLDVCTPDYFQGSSDEEVLAVSVWKGMTKQEFYEACKSEFHGGSGWFDDVAGSGTMAEEALHSMVSCLDAGGYFEQSFPYCPTLEEYQEDEDLEFCYAYVGLKALED